MFGDSTKDYVSFSALQKGPEVTSFPKVDIDPKQDTCNILLTSGTTGPPKGAETVHSAAISQLPQLRYFCN